MLPAAVALAFVALTLPTWRWLWAEWMANDYYSHGILIPPVTAFLIWQRIRHDDGFAWRPGSGAMVGLLVLVVSLAIYLWALTQRANYLAAFAMIGMIAGIVGLLGGTSALRPLLFPIAFLGFMVPLPLVERSTLPLAMFTGVCAGGLVQFLGLDVTIVGNAITLPNANLVIGAQCSGVNSLIALTALLTLVAYLVEGPLWARLLLVALAAPLALLGNILRVASLLFVARTWGADAAFTFYHDYSAIFFFLGVIALLYPITRWLGVNELRPSVI
ncbi:MAG: exosortase/archaeosortase family protein [Caldilineaceae bacterium]